MSPAPTPLPLPGPGAPTPPIELPDPATAVPRIDAQHVPVPEPVVDALRGTGATVDADPAVRAEASRDWWPLAIGWALDNELPARADVVVRPRATEQVAAVLRICNEAAVPVTTVAGRSGVCGAAVPVHGGVALDVTALSGIVSVDDQSLVVDVAAGTFGDHLEDELRNRHGLTLGHWPQSIALSTVGGWVACRSAGQLSNRYGKIEDIVVGLDVVMADGSVVRTGGAPRAAVGPDLTQMFVGSEGTLGVVTSARLRLRPVPQVEGRAAYGFASWFEGMDACRRILRRGADPAVLRLYDAVESDRSYGTGDLHVLLVMDEGDPLTVDANMAVVAAECAATTPPAARLDDELVGRWFEHRNDVAALESLTRNGFVVDTMEIAAPWSRLDEIYTATVDALSSVDGVRAASAHQSHAYADGACLYFSFAGRPPDGDRDDFYVRCWDVGTRAVLDHGGSLSHHHGVGLHRSRFVAEALGSGLDVLVALKHAMDPRGILNPGKLGLPDPWGAPRWP